MVTLKQAAYRPLKISGKRVTVPGGCVFLGLAAPVMARDVLMKDSLSVFITQHSLDMKILAVDRDSWLECVAGYDSDCLPGVSIFELVHGQDCQLVRDAFRNCE